MLSHSEIHQIFFQNKRFPFSSAHIWDWLGYSKHANLVSYLDKTEFIPDVCLSDDKQVVGKRKRDIRLINRTLFCKLAKDKGKDEDGAIAAMFMKYKASELREKIICFEDTGKKKEYRTGIGFSVSGKFYKRSLNTLNLANDLEICPYAVFDFCSRNFCEPYRFNRAKILSRHNYGYAQVGAYYFDHAQHERRLLYFQFLDLMMKEFPLDDLKKLLLEYYIKIIRDLLDMQLTYDRQAGRMGKKATLNKEEKSAYRQAAMNLHPDKNPSGSAKFLQLQKAYENGDGKTIKKIANSLT